MPAKLAKINKKTNKSTKKIQPLAEDAKLIKSKF